MGLPTISIRAVLVDDQPLRAAGLAVCLADHGHSVCGLLHDVRLLPTTIEALQPDLVIIGLTLPGWSAARPIITDLVERSGTRVLVVASDLSPRLVQAVLEGGCLGVVAMTVTVDAFIAAAQAVAMGERHLHQHAFDALLHTLMTTEGPALSTRELKVLGLVADGLTNAKIAECLDISPATVKTHVEHLLRKLGAADRANAVSIALRRGLLD